jgi:hypothetical protein
MLFKYALYMRKYKNLMQFLLLMILLGPKSGPSSMDIICLQVPTRKFRDFALFHISPSSKNCLTASSAPAANSG